jgi:hypothetical protein
MFALMDRKIKLNNIKLSRALKYLTYPFEFSDITALVFAAHALVSVLGFLVLGASQYINGTSLVLMVVLDMAFCVALKIRKANNAAHIQILAWFVIMYFCVRLMALLFFPPETLEFLVPGGLNSEEISSGLLFVVSGTIALLLGIFAGGLIGSRSELQDDFQIKQFSLWAITGYWVITYLAAYYVRIYLGVTIFGPPENWGNRMGWVGIIFDTDVALILTICWAWIQWRHQGLTKYQMLHVGLLVLIWLAFSVIVGSRGGPLRILNCLFLVSLVINPNFRLSIAKFVILIAAFFIVNFYVFTMGTIFRGYHLGADDFSGATILYNAKLLESTKLHRPVAKLQQLPRSSSEGPLQELQGDLRRNFYKSESLLDIAMKMQRTVTRLALIDYPLVILSKNHDESIINYYIKSIHPIKNFINNMVPGEVFEESMVNTSRVFTMAYRFTSLQEVNEGFMSEPWTVWGMAWIFAEYYGIVLMFILAFGMQASLNYICRVSRRYYIYVNVVYFIVVINIGYIMFGIDHWLTAMAHFSLSFLIAYILVSVLGSLCRSGGQSIIPTALLSKDQRKKFCN